MEVPKNSLFAVRNGSNITLSRGETCGSASNYAIYEGNMDTIGTTWDHRTIICITGLTETFG